MDNNEPRRGEAATFPPPFTRGKRRCIPAYFFTMVVPVFGLWDDDSEMNTAPIDNSLPSRRRKKNSAACQTGFIVLRQQMTALQGCLSPTPLG